MTDIDQTLREQLCAWMDGELPADEARFLQRRLDTEPALRAQWERWQLASACLRGQPVRAMPADLCERVSAAVAAEPMRRASRWPWAAGIAAAVLAAVLLPRMLAQDPGAGLPGNAQLAEAPAAVARDGDILQAPRAAPVSPVEVLPSVRDFPLAESGTRKPWPRSPVAPDDRAMEDYLVRHNALMAEDGLGGFMPYVDVVAHERPVDGEDPR